MANLLTTDIAAIGAGTAGIAALQEITRAALQFFTRVPVTGPLAQWVGYSPQVLRASAGHFPGIGLLVGVLAASVYAALTLGLPDTAWTPLVAAILSTVATVVLTGAFHEDSLADVADGLGGTLQRARALEIMKDSRVGAFGVLAVVLAVLTKAALLALLGSADSLVIGRQRRPSGRALTRAEGRTSPQRAPCHQYRASAGFGSVGQSFTFAAKSGRG